VSPPGPIRIADITIGDRRRTLDANITTLAADVARNGIRDPIAVTSGGLLVDGWRRIEAVKRCRAVTIPAVVSDSIPEIADIVAAQPAGEPYRFSDLMRHIDLIFELDADDSERRRIASASSAGRGERGGVNVGGTRGCVCRMLRLSHATYGRAHYLWARAATNEQIIADLDAGRISVNRAYGMVRAADLAAEHPVQPPDHTAQHRSVRAAVAQVEGIAHGISGIGALAVPPEDAARLAARLVASRIAITQLINQLRRTNHA
jgi:hypothetical protein